MDVRVIHRDCPTCGRRFGPARRPGPQTPLLFRRLQAKAASTGFPEEADACRAKAEQLRAKYGLEKTTDRS